MLLLRRLRQLVRVRRRRQRSQARLRVLRCWRREAAMRRRLGLLLQERSRQGARLRHRQLLRVRPSSTAEGRQHRPGRLLLRRQGMQVRVQRRHRLQQAGLRARRWRHTGARQRRRCRLRGQQLWMQVRRGRTLRRSRARQLGLQWCTREATSVLLRVRRQRRLVRLEGLLQHRRRLRPTPRRRQIQGTVGTIRAAVARRRRWSHRCRMMRRVWVRRWLRGEDRLLRQLARLRRRLGHTERARQTHRRQRGWRQQLL